ncbi:hypothetical protein DES46_101632 [Caldimonas thermodepolymerans]|nr:hypothetical protein DES46_101632 [Caldimonas thermodepolymerans]
MNRTEARGMWQRIADGGLTDLDSQDAAHLHAWIRGVASRILSADDGSDAGQRPGRVLAAVGLSGKPDGYAALREVVNDVVWEFPVITADGELDETRAQLVRQMVEIARQRGLLKGVYAVDDKQATDLIRKILRKQI